MARSESAIDTVGGHEFDFLDPQADQIDLGDIAHGLANTCRYGGMCAEYFSVAQHAVLVSELLEEEGAAQELVLHGLHHDDHEAYLGDIPTPLKRRLSDWDELVSLADGAICSALGLRIEVLEDPIIKNADNLALRIESALLLPQVTAEQEPVTRPLGPVLEPAAAREAYLARHRALTTV